MAEYRMVIINEIMGNSDETADLVELGQRFLSATIHHKIRNVRGIGAMDDYWNVTFYTGESGRLGPMVLNYPFNDTVSVIDYIAAHVAELVAIDDTMHFVGIEHTSYHGKLWAIDAIVKYKDVNGLWVTQHTIATRSRRDYP